MDQTHLRRRDLLALAAAAGSGGCLESLPEGDGPSPDGRSPAATADGPDGEWTLLVDEQWETFDTDRWGIGFINREEWIPDDDASVSADHVVVKDGTCRLLIESKGTGPEGCYQGVINSSTYGEEHHPEEGIPIDPVPGQYVEARLKLPGRIGILPAFWMHPADSTWPPEIDVVELFQRRRWNERRNRRYLSVNAHWCGSGEPGDVGTHRDNLLSVDTGTDLTDSFNTYGCAWFENRIEWYFNGWHLLTRFSPPSLMNTLTAAEALPFGLIFSNHVNRIGQADLTESWTEEHVIDWVRVWELAN